MKAAVRAIAVALFLVLAGIALPGAAQEELPADDPPAGDTELETLDDAAPSEDEATGPGVEDPLAELDEERPPAGQDGEVTGATMERFNPTEKISEDRSVAFPNDI